MIEVILVMLIHGLQIHLDSLHIVEDEYHGSAYEGNECKKVSELTKSDIKVLNALYYVSIKTTFNRFLRMSRTCTSQKNLKILKWLFYPCVS